MKRLSNACVLAAVLTREVFLSGPTDTELDLVKQRACTTLHPQQSVMKAKLSKALGELREGVEATRRLVIGLHLQAAAHLAVTERSHLDVPPRGCLSVGAKFQNRPKI